MTDPAKETSTLADARRDEPRTTLGEKLVSALTELRDDLRSGEPLGLKYKITTLVRCPTCTAVQRHDFDGQLCFNCGFVMRDPLQGVE